MSNKIINTRIQIKRDTSTNWEKNASFKPLEGEIIFYTNEGKIKIGDGTTSLSELPFMSYTESEIEDLATCLTGLINTKANAGHTHNFALHYVTGLVVQDIGSSTKNEYLATKWSVADVNGIKEPSDGMSIAIRTPAAGTSGGVLLSIDGGASYYPIVRNVNTLVTTTYAAGSTIILTFNSTQTAKPYTSAGTQTEITGCWQTADYDANTKTTTGTANKENIKLFLAGATSQTSSGTTTYTNENVYIGTDNCLYSNGHKVATTDIATSDNLGLVKSSTTGTAVDRDYVIQVNSDGTMKVNVPWTDTTYETATESNDGLMSAEDKENLDTIVNSFNSDDANTTIDTIKEVLEVFEKAPEGTNIVNALASKVDRVDGKGLSTNDLTAALKANYDAAYTHSTSTHARPDATKVEASTINGKIKINGTDTTVYTHPIGTNPHGTTKSDVGLGDVENFKAVSTEASQNLTATEKSNARANIGAGTSNFSGSYNDLTNKPDIPTGAAANKGVDTSISAASTSTNLPTSAAVAAFVEGKGYKTTDNNTTYTFATGNENGQIKVTPSGGTEQNISVKGLGSAAYTNSSDYMPAGDTSHGTHVTEYTVRTALGTSSTGTGFLKQDGSWATPTGTDRSSLAYCETDASTAAKTAKMPGFALSSGQYILLRTTTTNSATSDVTLNINSTGAKPIKIITSTSITDPTTSNFPAGYYIANYDGTNWILTIITGRVAGTVAAGNHGHGYFDNAGVLPTKNAVVITNANGAISSYSGVTTTELNYIKGLDQNLSTTSETTFEKVTAKSFYATSDRRKKENIKEFSPQKSILELPIVEFDFKDSGDHQIGCIAQDLQEICPEIVSTDPEGYLSINENKIVYLLLAEIKKLKEETNNLKKEILELKK